MSKNFIRKSNWWQSAVFYEVFLRSFRDGNGDGIGDIPGLIERLDYLQELGIDAIYLSSHYPSPFFDGGFDITDFRDVDPTFGTLSDFRQLLEQVHARGMYLIIDFVLNHTSDQHPWFMQSRSSRDNPKRDWYVWHDPVDGGPPNNWQSVFHDSAWQLDPQTGQYYYHFFLKEQPDLNWHNPQVREAMLNSMRFWLDMGVDGFRMDAIGTVFEEPSLQDFPEEYRLSLEEQLNELRTTFPEPPSVETLAFLGFKRQQMYQHQWERPETHELMATFRSLVDDYDHRVLVGETDRCEYYGDGRDRLHLVFNFPLLDSSTLSPKWVRLNQRDRMAAIPASAWPCNILGNHDNVRIYDRYGDGTHNVQLAKVHTALLLTMRGTPFLYYGDEIGMSDVMLAEVGQFRDLQGIMAYQWMTEEYGLPAEEALPIANFLCRDTCRAPMQWDGSEHGGFCSITAEPWLPVHPNQRQGVHVEGQRADPNSLYSFVQRLLQLRRQTPALQSGGYEPVHTDAENYLAFMRVSAAGTCLIVLNMTATPCTVPLDYGWRGCELLLSSESGRASALGDELALAAFEVVIARLPQPRSVSGTSTS